VFPLLSSECRSSIFASRAKLLDWFHENRNDNQAWTGQLSTSALSTATAISALQIVLRECPADGLNDLPIRAGEVQKLIDGGLRWLDDHQNPDGGFGDTDRSHSNIATTLLVLAAWELTDSTSPKGSTSSDRPNGSASSDRVEQAAAAWSYVASQGGWDGLRKRYGTDKTFVIPILTNCALAGLVEWSEVAALPFEAAALPQSWYRFAKMPVVSYAVPALVAMGQAKLINHPPSNPIVRGLRRSLIGRTFRVLEQMQPDSGGYLEAVPLTSFVLMSLADTGRATSSVGTQAIKFIFDSVLPDGSWPIDTNLATWITSLSTRSLCHESLPTKESPVSPATIRWILSCQHLERHPFTGADPGGWGWTDLSGAVPDADDTPAALLALHAYCEQNEVDASEQTEIHEAVGRGIRWLIGLQNRDGGWPTFCRGWGQLPFDRSGSDLTGHALRAIHVWMASEGFAAKFSATISETKIRRAVRSGVRYLAKNQLANGAWDPLWFGNQDRPEEDNPIYGTSRVVVALTTIATSRLLPETLRDQVAEMLSRARNYLLENQNLDGGWGGGNSVSYGPGSTTEETAQAVEALSETIQCGVFPASAEAWEAIESGSGWLGNAIENGWLETSWPIGFYFAKLWYHERAYPYVFSLAALNAVTRASTQ
jgi:squalene-hopene/tetraprenyl-beta-curcumene cyclase